MDAIDIVAAVVLAFNVFVLCPYCIYSLLTYYRLSQQTDPSPIIVYRHFPIISLINVWVVITNLTERPFMVCVKIWRVAPAPDWSVDFFLAATWWGAMALFAIKCYHLYFQQRYYYAVADAAWRKDINPNEVNWYIANKQKYGNPLYLTRVVFFVYLAGVILDVNISAFVHQHILHDGVQFTLASVPVAIAIGIIYKARKLDDLYNLRNEILYQLLILLSSLSLYAGTLVVTHYVVINPPTAERTEWLIYMFVTDGVTIALALFSTAYPVHLAKAQRNLSDASFKLLSSASPCHRGTYSLLSLLCNYNSFKIFMGHLVREFCAENLLFLVELTQIKHSVQKQHNGILCILKNTHPVTEPPPMQYQNSLTIIGSTDNSPTKENENESQVNELRLHWEPNSSRVTKTDNNLCEVVDFNVKPLAGFNDKGTIFTYLFDHFGRIITPLFLPDSLPKTVAISGAEFPDLFSKMRFLYNKYVKSNSEHEINISWTIREALTKYFEDTEHEKDYRIFNIFDDAALEIFLLLHSAYVRFICTKEYLAMMKEHANKNDSRQFEYDDATTQKAFTNTELPIIRNATSYSKLHSEYS